MRRLSNTPSRSAGLGSDIEDVLEEVFDQAGTNQETRKKIGRDIQQRVNNLFLDQQQGIEVTPEQRFQAVLHPLWLGLLFARANRRGKILPEHRLTKYDYRRECLRRSPSFQSDLLHLHKQFPPIFVKQRKSRPFSTFPHWLQKMCVEKTPRLIQSNPQSLSDLKQFRGVAINVIEGLKGWKLMYPENGRKYFTRIGRSVRDWERALRELRLRWPEAGGECFHTGRIRDVTCSWLLVPSFTAFGLREDDTVTGTIAIEEWQKILSAVGTKAKLMIPIYPDTVAEDIDWGIVKKWKAIVYGPTPPRTHEKLLASRLAAYDLYQQLRTFSGVAIGLKISGKKARDYYLHARKDIHGTLPTGTKKARRILDVNPETHIAECAKCKRADRTEDWCHTGKALLRVVEVEEPRFASHDDRISPAPLLTGGGKRIAPKRPSDSLPDEE